MQPNDDSQSAPSKPLASGSELLEDMLAAIDWRQLKQFVEFAQEDESRLAETLELVQGSFGKITDRFYDHLLAFHDTRNILTEQDLKGRLKAAQLMYLQSIFGGHYEHDFFLDRVRVGLTHERIGLPLRWFLGSYWLYIKELMPIIREQAEDPDAIIMSLLKALILDAQVISSSYIDKAMARVTEYNERLEEMVLERTKQLTKWERLAAVGSMSAKVAHEIRNPLSSMSLNTELLSEELDGDGAINRQEAGELLESVTGEIERLQRLVDDYLRFARLPTLDLDAIDLSDLVGGLVRLVGPEFEGLGIEIKIETAPETPMLLLDRDQFRQAILNLLRNACEAMPTGGRLTVKIEPRDDGGVRLCVSDTGVGINQQETGKLFDPFYTTKDTGTGLGLPFVQQVVDEHRGEVRARGEPGRGSTFEILLPESLEVR